jgi:hypothetical protein
MPCCNTVNNKNLKKSQQNTQEIYCLKPTQQQTVNK